MNLVTVENDLITKLSTDVSGVEVRSWPDNPTDYKLLHPGGALLIRYTGSSYVEPEPNNQKILVHDRLAEWSITIVQKSLKLKKGQQGVYTLIESIRASLSGYTPASLSDASIMYPIRDRFLSESKGFWIYEIVFVHTFPEAEA